ncbi:hypothetical protein [Exiguobacterium sp. S22-S28]
MKDKPYVMHWKVSPRRKDRRTGPVTKIPQSDWLKYLWKQETKRMK